MNVLDFKRWADGQHISASLTSFETVESASGEQSARDGEARTDGTTVVERSPGGARRFHATLRWGK